MSKPRSEYVTYTPEVVNSLKKMVAGLPRSEGVKALGRKLNLSERQARTVYAKYLGEGAASVAASAPTLKTNSDKLPESKGAHMSFNGDRGEIDLVDESPRTLEELLQACKVDLNIWEVEKYVVNKWEMGRSNKQVNLTWSNGKAEGFVQDNGGIRKAPLWQVKAWLRRKVEASTLNQMLEHFAAQAAQHAPQRFVYTTPKATKADSCYVLNIQDLHLAKLAWSQETGHSDWDIKIAEEAYRNSVAELMSKVPQERVEEVVLIIGSDMLQVDNDKSTTTAGTYVDSDTRLMKAYDVACKMLIETIESIASSFKVKCVVFGGNHDRNIALFLGKYIEAWFRNHPNVSIDSSPRSRKYHGYGSTLIAFDHGDEVKAKDLPLLIMRENQRTIHQYRHIECLVGHLHTEQSDDYQGIVVRVAPALCSPDRWHAGKGFVGNVRRSQGLLYQRERGLDAIYYSTALE